MRADLITPQLGRVVRIEGDQALGDMPARPATQQRQHVLAVLERQRALPGAFDRARDPEAVVELRQQRLAVAIIDDQSASRGHVTDGRRARAARRGRSAA